MRENSFYRDKHVFMACTSDCTYKISLGKCQVYIYSDEPLKGSYFVY